MIASFTWQDSSPRPTRQGVAFNRPLINYPDSIRLHHRANHLHASLYARIRATKSERKAEKESPWNPYRKDFPLPFCSRFKVSFTTRGSIERIFSFWKSKVNRSRAIEPRIERIFFLEISRFKVNRSQRVEEIFLEIEKFCEWFGSKILFCWIFSFVDELFIKYLIW